MTSFVHVDQPLVHPGVRRAEVLLQRIAAARRNPASVRHLLALLLIAVVATAVAVAETLVSDWSESRLLAAWVVLCGALFAGAALYAHVLRGVVVRAADGVRAVAQRNAAARADARFLESARNDPRVMHELQAAITRLTSDQETMAAPSSTAPVANRRANELRMPTLYEAMRRLNSSRYY